MPIEVPFRFEDERLLWSIDNVYSVAECDRLIRLIEASEPQIATNNPLFRNQDRVIRDDPEMARELFYRLKYHLPHRIGNLEIIGINERLRMYRYRVGQCFKPHMDHWYRPNETSITLHTVLVYLNGNFEGGETRFSEQLNEVIKPVAGLVAIFQHKLRIETIEKTSMSGIKRTIRKYGKVKGHRQGIEGTNLLSYAAARRQIYLPCYRYVLENYLEMECQELRTLANSQSVVLLDYETNGELDNLNQPLSHAWLIVKFLKND
jgi:prolyl 4-hydroxylase